MALRTPNNPYPMALLLSVLGSCLNQFQGVYNTYLASISPDGTGAVLTFVQNKFKMSQAMTAAQPYALHLSGGSQRFSYNGGPRNRDGQVSAIVEFCARWDTQPSSVDAIRATLDADIERMKANIESNDSLELNSMAHIVSIPAIALNDYKGEYDTQFPGLTLIQRVMTLGIQVLPYDC